MTARPPQPRQLECVRLAAEGLEYAEIGRRMHIARGTVDNQLREVRQVLGARNTAHAVHIAHQRGLIGDGREDRVALVPARHPGARPTGTGWPT